MLPADVVATVVERLRSSGVEGQHLANESAPDAPDDAGATSVDSGAQ
jgi:hypothetical protein